MPSNVNNCSELFIKLKLFQSNIEHDRIITVKQLIGNIPKKKLIQDRQELMKHILDCIGALRFIHQKYTELIIDADATVDPVVDISRAKDEVFIEAISLSMTGIFDCSRRDLRVDLLCNAFPGEESQHWFPLHWAMLAGSTIDAESVETIYNEDPMALEQYHQKPYKGLIDNDQDILRPQECWTPAHFLCVAINEGPNLLGEIKKYITLNAGAFTKSPLSISRRETYGVLHILLNFVKIRPSFKKSSS